MKPAFVVQAAMQALHDEMRQPPWGALDRAARAVLAVPAVADAFRDAERLRSLAATFGDDLEGALARDAKVAEETHPAPAVRPVTFIDPSTNTEHALTVREAAAVIVTLQAMEGEGNDIDPATTYPEMVPIAEVLRMAHDGECYAEHTEANVLPFRHDPHEVQPDGTGDCEICGDIEAHAQVTAMLRDGERGHRIGAPDA